MTLRDRHLGIRVFWLANLAPLLIGAALHVSLERVYDVELEHCVQIESSREWSDANKPAPPAAAVNSAFIDVLMLSATAPRTPGGSAQPLESADSHILLKHKLIPLLT